MKEMLNDRLHCITENSGTTIQASLELAPGLQPSIQRCHFGLWEFVMSILLFIFVFCLFLRYKMYVNQKINNRLIDNDNISLLLPKHFTKHFCRFKSPWNRSVAQLKHGHVSIMILIQLLNAETTNIKLNCVAEHCLYGANRCL